MEYASHYRSRKALPLVEKLKALALSLYRKLQDLRRDFRALQSKFDSVSHDRDIYKRRWERPGTKTKPSMQSLWTTILSNRSSALCSFKRFFLAPRHAGKKKQRGRCKNVRSRQGPARRPDNPVFTRQNCKLSNRSSPGDTTGHWGCLYQKIGLFFQVITWAQEVKKQLLFYGGIYIEKER